MLVGEFYSLLAAVIWALAVILFKKSGESHSPFTLNMFRVALSSVLFLLTLWAAGGALLRPVPVTDYLLLAASGIIAIAISDTLFHKSLNLVGAGITAIVDCLYSPFVVVLAFLIIDERLGVGQYSGMVLVVAAVFIAARHPPPAGASRGTIVLGIACGVGAMATLALGIVIAKPVLDRSPVIWATTVRQLASFLAMIPFAFRRRYRGRMIRAFTPGRQWRFSLPGTILGSYLALLCWIAGMKYTAAGAAAILNQTSTIYTLIFAWLFLREPLTRRKVAAALLAVAGILLVTLG